ncbi:PREDICTED: OTU domain-containing protein At3g57810 isoform X2 [Theobroma cacao]|uniref:Ubiquitin thioesterase OTU n=1 Tax=Theobroma cacao TaxID=3641 RepID=A0AB32W0Q6_THECC|nr:PREDICTED: OTU domain-containing protein At3g57810 isoform X2 [Theobroma cacao]
MEYSEGIPGDGRCLFRSVVHGAWLRAGKQSPSESHQKELADELRAKVADEFIKRRADTEWFVEGDFDNYVVQMRQPHIWGGEPELLMCSHVLQMPITVHMREKSSGILKIISEYGQEYGKENPVGLLYHGYGHYDVLRGPVSSASSKLFASPLVENCWPCSILLYLTKNLPIVVCFQQICTAGFGRRKRR